MNSTSTFNAFDWIAPGNITTPDFLSDIRKYISPEISDDYFQKLNQDTKTKLTELCERIEFIHQLRNLSEYASKNGARKIEINDNRKGRLSFTEFSKFEFSGYDFSGINFDIDALVFYLTLTCIDTIKGQPKYKDPFQWIAEEKPFGLLNPDDDEFEQNLKLLSEKHKSVFGLSRLFVEAFTKDLCEEAKSRLADNIMIVKFVNSSPDNNSLAVWQKLDANKKVEKIAKHLYEIRSKYTHKSVRKFIPSEPLTLIEHPSGVAILCKKDFNIIDELIACIRKLAHAATSRFFEP